jgi:hypothetical protein
MDRFSQTTWSKVNGSDEWNLNVRNLYRSGSLESITKELANYILDLVGVMMSHGVRVTPNTQTYM